MGDFIAAILKKGGIGVIPTDTIYGIVAKATNKKAVERLYGIRSRNINKPFIILLASRDDLHIFGIRLKKEERKVCNTFWPGPVSVILPCPSQKFRHLHRGGKTIAFRVPKNKNLINLLKITGPLVAPSANKEGKPPAKTVEEAQKYFGNEVDFYIDGGKQSGKPSSLMQITNGKVIKLR